MCQVLVWYKTRRVNTSAVSYFVLVVQTIPSDVWCRMSPAFKRCREVRNSKGCSNIFEVKLIDNKGTSCLLKAKEQYWLLAHERHWHILPLLLKRGSAVGNVWGLRPYFAAFRNYGELKLPPSSLQLLDDQRHSLRPICRWCKCLMSEQYKGISLFR